MKYQYVLVACLVLVFSLEAFSQQKSKVEPIDSLDIQMYLERSKKMSSKDLDSSLTLASKALALSEKGDFNQLKAKSHNYLGNIKHNMQHYDKAIIHFNESLKYFEQKRDSVNVFSALNGLCNAYYFKNDFPQALIYGLSAMTIATTLYNRTNPVISEVQIGSIYGNLGNCYKKMGLSAKAIASYDTATSYFDKANSNFSFICLQNIGVLYLGEKDYEKSYKYSLKAFNAFSTAKNGEGTKSTANNVGLALIGLDNYIEAKRYFHISLALKNNNNFKAQTSVAFFGLARAHGLLKSQDSALFYIDKSIQVAKELDDIERLRDGYLLKSELLEVSHPKEAIELMKKARIFDDSLSLIRNIPKSTSVLLDHQKKKDTRKLIALKADEDNKRVKLYSVLAIILLSLLFVLKYYFNTVKKVKVIKKNEGHLQVALNNSKTDYAYLERKMTTTMAKLALKDEIFARVSTSLKLLKDNKDPSELVSGVTDASKILNDHFLVDRVWEEFFAHFNEVHPKFLEQLQQEYELSQNDLRLCAFIKMNLSNKEITQLLNLSPKSIHTIIHRLKRKLKLPKDVGVYEFIKSQT